MGGGGGAFEKWLGVGGGGVLTCQIIFFVVVVDGSFEKAAELEPDFEDVWHKWSLVLFDQSNFERAYEIIQQGIDELPDNAALYYRATAYLLHAGDYREAIINLEVALSLDYKAHEQLYDFFPELEKQKALFKLIEQYKK